MAEAILRHVGGDLFEAFSAGSHPAGFVHPLAIEAMRRLDIPVADQVSKGWEQFADTSQDVVITVCDDAAKETCPVWPGSPLTAHWALPDPTYHLGSEAERLEFALRAAQRLRAKIEGLIALDWSMNRVELAQRLQFLGEI